MEEVNLSIAALRSERQKAINGYDFKRAREIEEQIKTLKEASKTDGKALAAATHHSEFEKEKSSLRHQAYKLHSEYTKRLLQLRSFFQRVRVDAMNQKHCQEIQDLTTSYGMSIELEQVRPVPESRELLKVSKIMADMSRYEQAEQIYDEGKAVEQAICQKRFATVNDTYDAKQEKLLARQQKEVSKQQAELRNRIDLLCWEYDKEMQKLKQAYQLQAIKHSIPWTPSDIEKFFDEYALVDDDNDGEILKSPSKRKPKFITTQMRKEEEAKKASPSPHFHKHVSSVSSRASGLRAEMPSPKTIKPMGNSSATQSPRSVKSPASKTTPSPKTAKAVKGYARSPK